MRSIMPFHDIDLSVSEVLSAEHIKNAEGTLNISGNACCKIIYIQSGSFDETACEKSLLFIPENTAFSAKIKDAITAYIISFTSKEDIPLKPFYYKIQAADAFEKLFASVYLALNRGGINYMTRCKKWLCEIILRAKLECNKATEPISDHISQK